MDAPVDDRTDPYRLQRFIDAQQTVFEQALTELRAGRKRSHWMWFVFPQIEGLGHSAMAQHYALSSLDEARAYARHPVLGQRLRACTQAVVAVEGRSVEDIFGYPDHLKFHSSMTLFAATHEDPVFQRALDTYFKGAGDRLTLDRLAQ
ncbi:MAG TPA: DUF1810 domain-containing protein [Burkholderiaceae bacterium]|nr:DUF1810 domain-containing protein [Burkholderiaceae bacterium]